MHSKVKILIVIKLDAISIIVTMNFLTRLIVSYKIWP